MPGSLCRLPIAGTFFFNAGCRATSLHSAQRSFQPVNLVGERLLRGLGLAPRCIGPGDGLSSRLAGLDRLPLLALSLAEQLFLGCAQLIGVGQNIGSFALGVRQFRRRGSPIGPGGVALPGCFPPPWSNLP